MLFQKNILKKYLSTLPAEQVTEAWKQFRSYFLNADIQQNILGSKEEQFQEGFLRELFVKVFGYTLNPSPDFNLITEQKNETNSKKADGAILHEGKVTGIIELKDHKTPDLSKVETQAFGYKNQHPNARLVIISNFEKLRLYIDNTVEYREWNLFTLNEQDFRELYLCLAWEQVMLDTAIKIKEESVSSEDLITKALYKDYSQFKRALFADIVTHNPDYDQLLLFKKTQKILDRLLFIFFAEDGGLLPPNSMIQIIDQWEKLSELDAYVPLYDRVKKYFGYMHTGFKGKKYEIFAYNGGLFKPDEVLDNITISDDVLLEHTKRLSTYDFESEVDVNILGHIFENSLSEIEEMTQQIEAGLSSSPSGATGDFREATECGFDPTKGSKFPLATEAAGRGLVSKRKQDGVFYTPQYITKYIVENTVGRLCTEKKQELGIDETEYFADAHRQKHTKIRLLDTLTQYREWLKQITILDPACGSGAFLNAALRFLIDEHHKIDVMEAKVTESTFVYPDIDKEILEHNLFGVDINEESVEIAQLALWLRTAQPRRKLNTLNQNIKCGNSLISDPAIAGPKAFDWQKEFPQVFAKGGFDVVIGNPPYVLCQPSNTEEATLNYYKTFKVASYKIDLFHLFFEKSVSLLKPSGYMGFITPNTYLMNTYIEELRSFLLKQDINTLTLHAQGVFADASVDVASLVIRKQHSTNNDVTICRMNEHGSITDIFLIKQQEWENNTNKLFNIAKSLKLNTSGCVQLGTIASVTFGLQTIDKNTYVKDYQVDKQWEPCYTGKDIARYNLSGPSLFFKNRPEEVKAGGSWNMLIHHSRKIVVRQIGGPEPIFAYDKYAYATLNTMYSIVVKDKEHYHDYYVLAILSSMLIKKWWLSNYSDNKDLFPKIKGGHLKTIPVPAISLDAQQPFIVLADKMLSLHKDLQEKRSRFLRRLGENLEGVKITTALQTFDELDFAGFVAELKKQKIKLSLVQQDEWEPYFNDYKEACNTLREQIQKTDSEINTRVFDLYGLTQEEQQTVLNH